MDAGGVLFDKEGMCVWSKFYSGPMASLPACFIYIQISLEITCEEGSLLTYFGGSVENFSVRMRQSRTGLEFHLEAAGATLVDSSIDDRGEHLAEHCVDSNMSTPPTSHTL